MDVAGPAPADLSKIGGERFPLAVDPAEMRAHGLSGDFLNPSLCWYAGKLLASLRLQAGRFSHVFLAELRHVELPSASRVPRSLQELEDLPAQPPDTTWKLGPARKLLNWTSHLPDNWSGFEDVRLCTGPSGELWANAAAYGPEQKPQQVILRCAEQASGLVSPGDFVRALPQPTPRHEKNWMPVGDGSLRWVYSVEPLVVLQLDPRLGAVSPNPASQSGRGRVRGGSQLVPLGAGDSGNHGGFVAVVHELHDHAIYTHRLAAFDRALTRVRFGPPFYFEHQRIEFCAGLARAELGPRGFGDWLPGWGRDGSDWLMTYGDADKAARLAVVPDEEFRRWLPPPEEERARCSDDEGP